MKNIYILRELSLYGFRCLWPLLLGCLQPFLHLLVNIPNLPVILVDTHTYTIPYLPMCCPMSDVMEGDSVTLSCCGGSYPPAQIRWFKGGTYLNYGQTYSISKISSDHSGEYKCRSINGHGAKDSDAVTLNVIFSLYKSVWCNSGA
uniref:Ig-like domain-containing protein n=1 Tax=Sinocyclocheilus rhinocerous TaxID=307959 RepID=A0A673MIX6_9TELE